MIIGALLVKDEAGKDRYLERVLKNAFQFCGKVVVLDDGSQDNTREICEAQGAQVFRRQSQEAFWDSNESSARAMLWDLATKDAGPDDWIWIFDADHELLDTAVAHAQTLTQTSVVNAWAYPLYDCWDSDTQMRTDGYWQAHLNPRIWLVKALPYEGYVPEWSNKAIHSGHIPHNYPLASAVAPGGIKHLGYINAEHRLTKAEKYLSLGSKLTPFEREHAKSILESPILQDIPGSIRPKVLVASLLRKPLEVVEKLVETIQWQETEAEVTVWLVPNYGTEGTPNLDALPEGWVQPEVEAPEDGYGEHVNTRAWTAEAWHRIGALKDEILKQALTDGYDYVWLLDADVMCDPMTLQSMLDCETPIVSAVYWTKWRKPNPEDTQPNPSMPQVWLKHPYQMSDNLTTQAEFYAKLAKRQKISVGGLGACTLISAEAIRKGASFASVGTLEAGPMADGEDRHFCLRAASLHIPLVADAWPDIWHAYHPSEYSQLDQRVQWIGIDDGPHRPEIGNSISATLRMLEPAANQNGQLQMVAKQWVRGRLGAMKLMPEYEEALLDMGVRETRVIKVDFPEHHEYAPLRGQTRMVEIKLLDVKTFHPHPNT